MIKIIYVLLLIMFWGIGVLLNKKKDFIIPFLLCLALIILMGGQQMNQDYEIYKNIFEGEFYKKDFGFGCIIQILKQLGFSSNNFRLGIAIIGFFLISVTVFKLLKKRSLFYILYGIYPFFFDVVQARNFLVMSILIFAVPFLIEERKRNKLIYIALILVASSIQKIAIVYLPIAFINGFSDKNCNKTGIKVMILVSIFFAINKNFLNIFISKVITPITGVIQEVSNYANINTNNGWIIFWLEQIWGYGLILFANFIYDKYNNFDSHDLELRKQHKFVKLMLDINYYMFIFLPLFILDENYTRIIRNVIPLTIIAIIIVLYNNRNKIYITKYSLSLIILTVIYLVFMFYLMARNYWESIVMTTFNFNWIIGGN